MTDRTTSKQLWVHSGIDGLMTVGIWTSHDQDSASFTMRPDEREELMKALQVTGPQHVVIGGYGVSVTRQYDTPPVNGVRTGPASDLKIQLDILGETHPWSELCPQAKPATRRRT